MARWTQAIEKIEALHLDELSDAELFQVFQSLSELRAELDAFEAKVRAELQRRTVAHQLN